MSIGTAPAVPAENAQVAAAAAIVSTLLRRMAMRLLPRVIGHVRNVWTDARGKMDHCRVDRMH
ncbi:hypothetical protein GCM10022243_12570 [Saccharothrix violaceirubra]